MTHYLEHRTDFENSYTASIYDELPLWSAPFGMELLGFVDYRLQGNVLDIGCGTGFPLIELAMRLGRNSSFYGIDPWEQGIERLKEKQQLMNVPLITLFNQPAENLPFPEKFFDLIISNNGLNNVDDLNKVISECGRVIKKGAKLIFTANLPETMKEFYDILFLVLKEPGLEKYNDIVRNHIHKKRKSTAEWQDLLVRNGFETVSYSEKNFDLFYFDGKTMLNHYFIRLYFIETWSSLFSSPDIPKIFKKLEKELDDFAEKSGGLKFSIPFLTMEWVKK